MKTSKSTINFILFAAIILLISNTIQAQFSWDNKPKNLKVLPDSIKPQQLRETMMMFTSGLDVRCNYCHDDSKGSSLNDMDFASDAKKTKQIARVMMKMVHNINSDFLQQANKIESLNDKVMCVTCHHGNAEIQPLSDKLFSVYQKAGIDSMFNEYNSLKNKFYGGFTYNFKDNELNRLGEKFIQQQKYDEAIRVLEFNSKLYPDSPGVYDVLGEAYLAKGDKAKAKEYFEKALSINPRDWHARQALQKLN